MTEDNTANQMDPSRLYRVAERAGSIAGKTVKAASDVRNRVEEASIRLGRLHRQMDDMADRIGRRVRYAFGERLTQKVGQAKTFVKEKPFRAMEGMAVLFFCAGFTLHLWRSSRGAQQVARRESKQ